MKRQLQYDTLVKHYEPCLAKHGSGAQAVDWGTEQTALVTYRMMLGIITEEKDCTLLDFGCGISGLKDYLDTRYKGGKPFRGFEVAYAGLDISEKFIAKCRELYPDT